MRVAERAEALRIAEALIFASPTPVEEAELAKHMADSVELEEIMQELRSHYEGRGINLVRVAKKWTFRTAADLGWLLSRETTQQKKLSRAALETLAICAYHQPVTRADIEEIRGVAISKGTLDVLIETGWVRLRGRRKAPGRPVTYGTTEEFLLHFGLENISDLPGLDELKGAGLFDGRLPPGFGVPTPNDSADLTDEEDPLEDGDDLLDYAAVIPEDGDPGSEPATAEAAMEAVAEVESVAEVEVEPVVETEAEVETVAEAGPAAEAVEPEEFAPETPPLPETELAAGDASEPVEPEASAADASGEADGATSPDGEPDGDENDPGGNGLH
ncbi:MAG: SMC-Scp complex subunit ScpB [Hyphomicrobiales bacterium]|nr:SMC-Scp complex subunit ScpB [Hyphomicrobiales bacterium]